MNAHGVPRSILFVLNSLGRGGSELKTVKLANGLVARGWRVGVAHLNGPDTLRSLLDRRVAVAMLHRRGLFSFRSLRRLGRFFDGHPSQVVVSINVYPALYVVGLRWLRRDHRLGLMASLNTTDFLKRSDLLKLRLFVPALKRFDRLVFGAREQQRLWCEQHGLPTSRSAVLYNGLDTQRFRRGLVGRSVIPGWPAGRRVVGTVGILRPEKGHLVLLDGIAELRRRGMDVGLLIVGDGPERVAIEDRLRRDRLEDVVAMVGDVEDVRPYLAAMDVFALPSVAVETFSNATLEAMAMGVPVVASRIGGMAEMLQYGGGRLVPPGDAGALMGDLQQLLSNDALRARLGQEARASAEAHFDVQVMVREFEELAAGVAASREGRQWKSIA
jgi:glycosyltransferase involved in cell wall biosynthesis